MEEEIDAVAKNRATEILRILQDNFSIPRWASSTRDPFQTLIITVLSQATADKNTARAFENLSRRFSITPEALAEASVEEIEKAIRVGGLYRNKSRVIKAISRVILEQFNGSLDFIHSLPLGEARKILLSILGVGPKTADVVLLFCAGKPTIPIDTHVYRVSKRLGLAPPKADYEEVRRALEDLYPPEDYLHVHLLLISLGRKYCKARKPLCKPCPVNMLCPSKCIED
ncbi:MAG: G/T mismatches repair enzyme [Candidatus Bathyarchaeota archaeon BA2]|nr:MAG: G/T mismatches repair enzyme [Candidatus Bathyarchaeota archaeon BA2]